MRVNRISQTGHGHVGFAEKLAGQTGFGTKVEKEKVELNNSTDDWTLAHYIHGGDAVAAKVASQIWVQKHSDSRDMKTWGRTADYAARKTVDETGA